MEDIVGKIVIMDDQMYLVTSNPEEMNKLDRFVPNVWTEVVDSKLLRRLYEVK